MDIQSLINNIAEQLSGTNALIQIQVEGKYYIKRVGDIEKLIDCPQVVQVRNTRSFPDWMQNQISRQRLSKGTIVNHQNTLDILRRFRHDFTFSDINIAFIKDFETYLRDLKYSVNTIAKFMKIFKRYLNEAMDNDIISANPFHKYKIRQEESHKNALSERELRKMENCVGTLEGDEREVMRGFLFGIYTGLRYSDIQQVRRQDIKTINREKWLVLRMRKTGREVRVPIGKMFRGKALDLVDDVKSGRLFHLPGNARSNVLIGRIAKRIGIRKHISFHCSRVSCATIMLARGGNLQIIGNILGHKSIKTTEVYAKTTSGVVMKGVKRIFK